MDFFERQQSVRTRSRRFFVVFGLTVALAVVVFYLALTLVFIAVFANFGRLQVPIGSTNADLFAIWASVLPASIYGRPPEIMALKPFLIVGSVIALIILTVSLRKIRAIREGGGEYLVAELMGGQLLENPETPEQKRLVNVVEEMAVAAGLPRPDIYILPGETGINAVTAGFEPEEAVVAVTEGALRRLDRRELQGVMAHEFAHIANGDCALNLTMAGWLSGLLFFHMRGKDLLNLGLAPLRHAELSLRGGGFSPVLSFSLVLGGTILMTGGWLGKLAAQAVQAAFSRQREYLADAYAAQYTRDSYALAGALKKIAAWPRHGALYSGQAEAMKSFFIVSPARFGELFRTHPPVEDRILELDPYWNGELPEIELPQPPPRPRLYNSDLVATPGGQRQLRKTAEGLADPRGRALVLALLNFQAAPESGKTRNAGPGADGSIQNYFETLRQDVAVALSRLAHLGAPQDGQAAAGAFKLGLGLFTSWPPRPLIPDEELEGSTVEAALDRLARAPFRIRRTLALAAATTALANEKLNPAEDDFLARLNRALGLDEKP